MNSIRSITKDWKNKLAYSVFGSAFTILGVIVAFAIGEVTAKTRISPLRTAMPDSNQIRDITRAAESAGRNPFLEIMLNDLGPSGLQPTPDTESNPILQIMMEDLQEQEVSSVDPALLQALADIAESLDKLAEAVK